MIGGMTGVPKDVIPFGLSIGNRNYLQGLNLIGLRRKKYDNKKIISLDKAYKEIFSSKNLYENLNKINGDYKDNELVIEVIKFMKKIKKGRFVCRKPKIYDWADFWGNRFSKIYTKKSKKNLNIL